MPIRIVGSVESRKVGYLREKAAEYRRRAGAFEQPTRVAELLSFADRLDAIAKQIERGNAVERNDRASEGFDRHRELGPSHHRSPTKLSGRPRRRRGPIAPF